jgi:GNAT superfamily N-acetyltransferase
MNIRPAQPADLPELLQFEQAIVATERPFDPTLREGEIHYYNLQELILSDNSEVLVAEIEGKLVGSGYAQLRKAVDYVKHTHFAYLGFMYVLPQHRGQGVIQAILEGLKQWAVSKNVFEIRLEVYDENIAAKKAYQKAGFSANLVEMRLELKK